MFALFNSNQTYRAIAAAISFKTFAQVVFTPEIKKKKEELAVGVHIGIDQRTVLVRKIGLRRTGGRTDRQNEVWAGKPVNMASKLAAKGGDGELWVSDRYYRNIDNELTRWSCGCENGVETGKKGLLWTERDLTADAKDSAMFDFDTAWVLQSFWCPIHGEEFFNQILKLDVG